MTKKTLLINGTVVIGTAATSILGYKKYLSMTNQVYIPKSFAKEVLDGRTLRLAHSLGDLFVVKDDPIY